MSVAPLRYETLRVRRDRDNGRSELPNLGEGWSKSSSFHRTVSIGNARFRICNYSAPDGYNGGQRNPVKAVHQQRIFLSKPTHPHNFKDR